MKTLLCTLGMLLAVAAGYAQHKQVHDAMDDKYGEPGRRELGDWMKNLQAKVEAEYSFNLSVMMHVTNYKKKDRKDEMDMHYYFNAAKNLVAFDMEDEKKKNDMFTIYDWGANSMIMLDQKKKTGMAMNMNAFMSKEMQEKRTGGGADKSSKSTDCTKTGKTKKILGYDCVEYVCRDAEKNTRTEVWITTKLKANMASTWARGPWAAYSASMSGVGGMMMEANFYKDNKLETNMLVTALNEKETLAIKTAEYKFTDMGAGMK